MTQPYKICPQCQQPAALEAPQCQTCGRQYRTQFNSPERTQVGVPAPPVASPPANLYPISPALPPPPPSPLYPPAPTQYGYPPQPYYYGAQVYPKSKTTAALLSFFLGGLGIHGFYLGNTTMGITFLLVYLISIPLIFAFGLGLLLMFVIGMVCLVQTICYAVATDAEFHQKYVVEKRWF